MRLPRQNKVSEAEIQKMIVQTLELLWKQGKLEYIRHHPIRPVTRKGKTFFVPVAQSQKGAPDLFVFPKKLGEYWLIETKSITGKISPEQAQWGKLRNYQQCRYWLVHTVKEAGELVDWMIGQLR